VKQDPIQWLRCYALSIQNAGGNNGTKCLYFPFCLDQAPLTWLESLEKYSIDKWDQLKEQFTSNFAGAMGRSGTRMDPSQVHAAFLRQARHRSRRHRQGGHRPSPRRSLPPSHLRRLRSTPPQLHHPSSADEEDKASVKYDAIRGKSKQNTGGGSSNNGNQGGRSNNYSGPNRKHNPDNTVAAIQCPAKENSKKTSGGFKDLLKEKCPWHLDSNHTTEQCYKLRRALKDTPEPRHPHDKKGKKKNDEGNGDF
jgi:hypothetical protein